MAAAASAHDPSIPSVRSEIVSHMVRVRAISARMVRLQREGKIGYHASSIGDEAVIVGATLAARPNDWLFPGMREWAAALVRGMPLANYVHHAFGSAKDPALGHSAPDHAPGRAFKIVPPSGVVGAHLPQGVGAAWAAKTREDKVAAIVLFGKEAIDTGDFHNAMNFAGVMKAPVVFVCRAPVADRAVAYGLASAIVDGGDVNAVHHAVEAALAREGATLVQAVPPSFADLATREDLYDLGAGDPLHGVPKDHAIEAELDRAIAEAEAAGPPAPSTIFDHVFAFAHDLRLAELDRVVAVRHLPARRAIDALRLEE
jgi:TPP-dependent pyruvate/acetoin dehydrogenase alpha subunit